MHGQQPFPQASLQHNILSLQILFCVVAVPLMFLSAVMADARRTQESLRRMSGSLIEAQEQERARIGRELHDDINQRLAMLALELERLQEDHPEVRSRLQEIRQQASEISADVQALSHDLHSSKLEYLGVLGGIKSWCNEFARVLQEALQNAVKHSGVKRKRNPPPSQEANRVPGNPALLPGDDDRQGSILQFMDGKAILRALSKRLVPESRGDRQTLSHHPHDLQALHTRDETVRTLRKGNGSLEDEVQPRTSFGREQYRSCPGQYLSFSYDTAGSTTR